MSRAGEGEAQAHAAQNQVTNTIIWRYRANNERSSTQKGFISINHEDHFETI